MVKRERLENGTDINAFLGEGTDFKGVLAFEGTVRIDGKLEGEIVSDDTLIVGEQAVVNAEINIGSVIISGKISGDITAKNRVDIKSTGEVYGNIQTPILTIDEGVIFQGSCDMRREAGDKKHPAPLTEREPEALIQTEMLEEMEEGSESEAPLGE